MKTSPDDLSIAALVLQTVSRECHVPLAALESSDRHMTIVWARWIAIHLIRKYTQIHNRVIGELLNKDRTTIIKSLGDVPNELEKNPPFRSQMMRVETIVLDAIRNPQISLAS